MAKCVVEAKELYALTINLESDIQNVLQQTNGVISWRRLAHTAGVQGYNSPGHYWNKGIPVHCDADAASVQQ